MSLLAREQTTTFSIEEYGEIAITWRVPTALDVNKMYDYNGNILDREKIFRNHVVSIKAAEDGLCTIDGFLTAPGTGGAFLLVVRKILDLSSLQVEEKKE